MDSRIKNIHMVGIGGAGMCGIAEILLNLGYSVSGSDMVESASVRRLRDLGATVHIGHAAENLSQAHVLVKSTAIREDNPEVVEARRRCVPVIPRAEMLAELMRLRQGVAIAGTHGKTTTTSLVASIFHAAGLDPTVVIGGRLNAYGTNAHLGKGKYLIAEADESDGSFLCLLPIFNVVTNVDEDHLDHYGTRAAMEDAFVEFMNNVPFYGLDVVCGDDPGVRALLPRIKRPVLTYGLGESNTLRAVVLEAGAKSRFEIWNAGEKLGEVVLPQPGVHNVLNALAATGIALADGSIGFEQIKKGLEGFGGVGRRFEYKGTKNGVTVIDDYGHHPREIAATLATARQVFAGKRIVVAFQPHRYTRTKALFDDFCKVFDPVDEVMLTEIYAASEKPIPGICGEALAKGICGQGRTPASFYPTIDALVDAVDSKVNEGDVLLTLGAGTITKVGPAWLARP